MRGIRSKHEKISYTYNRMYNRQPSRIAHTIFLSVQQQITNRDLGKFTYRTHTHVVISMVNYFFVAQKQ